MTTIKLIVGLANPGSEYAQTRHNAGEWLINSLAAKYGQSLKNEPKFFGYTSKITIASQDIRLLVPTTFMNLSGKSVQAIANFYNIKPDEILVAHDELDINPGIAKLKFGGSHGGHNGLKDIANKLGNNLNFYRLRIGIGHPGDKSKVVGYVLNKPSKPEQELIDQAVDESVYSIEKMLSHGIEAAMNHLHAFKAK